MPSKLFFRKSIAKRKFNDVTLAREDKQLETAHRLILSKEGCDSSQELGDVTLVCKDKQQIGAHRVVLSAHSESKDYFLEQSGLVEELSDPVKELSVKVQ